ncbi:hypothetical protein AB0I94_35790 [Streptomyces sp. NPDC050147]|uniref:hypothetical protein n=1 Tax=Streptomyces sp. NPDC050147 TaxID=3155513 RepID=UPI00343A5CEA
MAQRNRWLSVAVGTALLTGGLIATSPPAAAGGCTVGYICGKVINDTRTKMHYTTNLGSKRGTGTCDVWNKHGNWERAWKNMKCTQVELPAPGKRGGDGTGTDVDAFTFNHTGYYLKTSSSQVYREKGVWTKFTNEKTLRCYWASKSRPVVCTGL